MATASIDSEARRVALSLLAGIEPAVTDVAEYARHLFGIPVPESPFGDMDSPADFLRELWIGNQDVVCTASRDSYKTLTVAAAEFLLAHYRGVQVLHYGAREFQAKRAWEYLAGFAGAPHFRAHVEVTLSGLRFASGGSLELLPLTPGSVRSPHVELSVFDEADEMDPRLRGVAVGIKSSSEAGVGRQVDVSTRNRPDGVMARRIAAAGRARIRTMTWSYKVAAARCPDEISGTRPAEVELPDGTKAAVFDGCLTCPIVMSCLGDLKRSEGARPVRDLIAKFLDPSMTPRLWRSEYENLEPSTEGLVIPEFDVARSVTDDAEYDPRLPYALGVDFGANNLGVVVAGQRVPYKYARAGGTARMNLDRARVNVFDMMAMPLSFSPHMEERISREWVPKYGFPSAIYVDPSGFPALGAAKLEGRGTTRRIDVTKAQNRHLPGFHLLRGMLVPRRGEKSTSCLIHPRLEDLVAELRTLSYVQAASGDWTEQVERTDRTDALRYLLTGLSDLAPPTPEEAREALEVLRGFV